MKRYGIRIRLPEGSTMGMPHLLGPDWESYRWYDSEQAREKALADMQRDLPNYRKGDHVSQVLERVERDG
ncbi:MULTISPECIES: hypothetical protein [unclassified Thioalkalivibrio]|jgi:hypothetical protein|uniref:hypothetical protein n=1 Tax=unclassified Thioalkalivibrio TaxID=2621013 RepID=UPI0003803548|nr:MULTISPECIES: hypothetical protein [unclassified Thioalkalivibrio]